MSWPGNGMRHDKHQGNVCSPKYGPTPRPEKYVVYGGEGCVRGGRQGPRIHERPSKGLRVPTEAKEAQTTIGMDRSSIGSDAFDQRQSGVPKGMVHLHGTPDQRTRVNLPYTPLDQWRHQSGIQPHSCGTGYMRPSKARCPRPSSSVHRQSMNSVG